MIKISPYRKSVLVIFFESILANTHLLYERTKTKMKQTDLLGYSFKKHVKHRSSSLKCGFEVPASLANCLTVVCGQSVLCWLSCSVLCTSQSNYCCWIPGRSWWVFRVHLCFWEYMECLELDFLCSWKCFVTCLSWGMDVRWISENTMYWRNERKARFSLVSLGNWACITKLSLSIVPLFIF